MGTAVTAADAGPSEAKQGGTYLPLLDFKEPSAAGTAAGSVDCAAEAAQASAASVGTCMGTSGTSAAEVTGAGADDDDALRVVGEGGLEMGCAGGVSRSMGVGGLETGGVGREMHKWRRLPAGRRVRSRQRDVWNLYFGRSRWN